MFRRALTRGVVSGRIRNSPKKLIPPPRLDRGSLDIDYSLKVNQSHITLCPLVLSELYTLRKLPHQREEIVKEVL